MILHLFMGVWVLLLARKRLDLCSMHAHVYPHSCRRSQQQTLLRQHFQHPKPQPKMLLMDQMEPLAQIMTQLERLRGNGVNQLSAHAA